MNISAAIWPTLVVPKAFGVRPGRLIPGCAFELAPSKSYLEQSLEGNWKHLEVSR